MISEILTTTRRIETTVGEYIIQAEATYKENDDALTSLAGGIVTTADADMPVATFDGFGPSMAIYYNTAADRTTILGAIEVFINAIQTQL